MDNRRGITGVAIAYKKERGSNNCDIAREESLPVEVPSKYLGSTMNLVGLLYRATQICRI